MPSSILIVDNEKNALRDWPGALERRSRRTRSHLGEDALKAFEEAIPDLIILDQRMPGMGGLATLTEIKKDHPDLPVIMLTAHGNVESAVQAMKASATEYLTKPF